MKVGLIYTSTTPELIADVEREVRSQIGDEAELYSLQDPSILADVREAGYVTTAPAARLIGMYMKAAEEGCDAVLNLCSSVGEVADCAQDCAKYIGMPIVRLDEEQFRARMSECAATIADKVDVIVLAQGSMAYCEQYLADKFGKVVLSSPRFGAAELKKALVKKGLM